MFLKLTHVIHSNNETVTAASDGDNNNKKVHEEELQESELHTQYCIVLLVDLNSTQYSHSNSRVTVF